MTDLSIRLVRKLFTAEVMGLMLVMMALQIFTEWVSASLRNTDTQSFYNVYLLAAAVGLGLGYGKWHPLPVWIGIVAFGVAGGWVIGGRLALPTPALVR